MPEPMPLYLENIENTYLLHALGLPGCYSEGGSEAEACDNFPDALFSYRDWLVLHGETIPDLPDQFDISERFASYRLTDGFEVNALFEPERWPSTWESITLCIRLLGYSRADLLAAMSSISGNKQDTAIAVGERTPREILEHIARAECWYLSHFTDIPPDLLATHAPGTTSQLEVVRGELVKWLANICPEELGTIKFDREEEWSVRKLLRRALWHERTHCIELIGMART